jgi:hypothetical protein
MILCLAFSVLWLDQFTYCWLDFGSQELLMMGDLMSWRIKRKSVKFVDFDYVEVGLTNYIYVLFDLSNNCSGLYRCI